jgi:hypothetical protein
VRTNALVAWMVFGVAVSLPAGADTGFDMAAFGHLPVSASGHVQPIETVARKSLLQIRGTVNAMEPTTWLLEVLAKPDTADTRPIFPIESRELIGKLGLRAQLQGTNYFSFKDLAPKAPEIQKQPEFAALREKLVLYERLKNSLQPNSRLQQEAKGKPITFDFAAELTRYQADLAEALKVDAARKSGSGKRLDVPTEMRIRTFSRLFQFVSRTGVLAVVPPSSDDRSKSGWRNLGTVILDSAQGHEPPAPVAFFAGMSSAFAQEKPDVFNSQVAKYREWLAANHPPRKGD